jgi:peptidoglycan hydrolase-like protein with peptidoglycan-binding domain
MQRLKLKAYPEVGDDSSDVRTLQLRLLEVGEAPGPVDGKFGARTKAAVISFQKKKLPGRTFEDGSVGAATLDALALYIGTDSPVAKPDEYIFLTQDLQGKKQRKILPELRKMIELRVFANGHIPKAFLDRNIPEMACLVAEALESMKIREVGGNNRGKIVGLVQSVIGGVAPGGDGLAWCMSIDQVIVAFVEDWCGVESPVPASEGVTDTYSRAKAIPGLTTLECERGTIACAQLDGSWMGHAMFVMQALPGKAMATFEGNTNDAGSRDGHGAFFKTRDRIRNDGKTTLGFVRIYPHNILPGAV